MDNITSIDMQPVPFGLVLLKYLHTPRRVAPFFAWAKRLGDEYDETSRWEGRALSNNGFYLVPNSRLTYGVSVAGNGYEGTMTAEAFGITLSLFALGQLANTTEEDSDRLIFYFSPGRDFSAWLHKSISPLQGTRFPVGRTVPF